VPPPRRGGLETCFGLVKVARGLGQAPPPGAVSPRVKTGLGRHRRVFSLLRRGWGVPVRASPAGLAGLMPWTRLAEDRMGGRGRWWRALPVTQGDFGCFSGPAGAAG
jgi:hypothetical protein